MASAEGCYYEWSRNDCYDGRLSADKCHLPTGTDIFLQYSTQATNTCPATRMDLPFDKHSKETLQNAVRSVCTIMATVVSLPLARLAVHSRSAHSTLRFLVEFALIVSPTVYFVTVGDAYMDIYIAATCCLLCLYAWRTKSFTLAKQRDFELGKRPSVLTLTRATAYICTAVAILAIDFESFPRVFRKSRRFGASLMDTGIGIFVLTMGLVSRRAQNFRDFRRLGFVVVPLLLLGLARTIVISIIGYGQDEHEYGVHLNAFFTLGFAKLFGTFVSLLASTDAQLFPLSIGLLAVHELCLQLGVSDYVMDDGVERDTLLNANREGIVAAPGIVAIYLYSIAFSNWLRTKSTLTYSEIMQKLRTMALANVVLWLLVAASAYTIGISRVTCNFGYAVWIAAICVSVVIFYMLVFDVVLNSTLPASIQANAPKLAEAEAERGAGEELATTSSTALLSSAQPAQPVAPILAEALNMNGLVYFLLANLLTGAVNIFLSPDERSSLETIVILNVYMLLASGIVYLLYRKHIRIA